MSLRHAILTALLERPSSGLDLTRRFDRSIGYFWSATHQQIYRELAKLETEKFVVSIPQQPSRGGRKVFEVLPAGRDELVAWIARPEPPRPERDPLLVRLRAASVVGLGPLLEQLTEHRRLHEELHRQYIAIAERDFAATSEDLSRRLQHLILRAGLGLEEFWVRWLDEAIAELGSNIEEENPHKNPPMEE
ncbi:PadR family transcriptional regulator [Gordonia sihwensis]|uniref:PadR family transcriptional regulator n=1 Tax=Gordonia sihwensis TaxID=173559 RepID=UPI003D9686A4